MRTSYKNKDEVILLLNDVTGKVEPVSQEERKRRVANGEFVRSIIIKEYEVSSEYTNIVNSFMDDYIDNMAKYVGILAEKLYEVKGRDLVLVDIVRAGIPIGILVRRYIQKFYNVDIPHYGISLVQGLDKNAMKYIMINHKIHGIQFLDGWTGKGTVAKEIKASVERDFPGVDSSLACLSDCINQAKYVGTREDVYIPHSPLNASVTGLVSITVHNDEHGTPEDYHSAVYLSDLEKYDQSQSFVDRVSAKFKKQNSNELHTELSTDDKEIDEICLELNRDKKALNPGINEAARAVLRRDLEKLMVVDKSDYELRGLIALAEHKNIPVVEMSSLKGYKAVSVARDNYIR